MLAVEHVELGTVLWALAAIILILGIICARQTNLNGTQS